MSWPQLPQNLKFLGTLAPQLGQGSVSGPVAALAAG
jgi:hypothetical protein